MNFVADRKQTAMSYLTVFVGPTVPDECVKFDDLRLNRSREIRPKAVGHDIFGHERTTKELQTP